MGFYRAWGDRLHGMATFHDFVLRLEKLGSSTKLKVGRIKGAPITCKFPLPPHNGCAPSSPPSTQEYMKNLRLGVEVRRNVQGRQSVNVM